jgi:hydrogenase expression/formation protein HypC
MCLAVPGKILEIVESEGGRAARVEFGGITRPVRLDFVPEAQVGDYVIVHVGFALSRVDAEEAARTYQLLEEMGLLEGLPEDEAGPGVNDAGG